MDMVERLQEKDIQQAAIAMAWFAHQAAVVDQRIPRPKSGHSKGISLQRTGRTTATPAEDNKIPRWGRSVHALLLIRIWLTATNYDR
jgi:hypothetical protein